MAREPLVVALLLIQGVQSWAPGSSAGARSLRVARVARTRHALPRAADDDVVDGE